MENDLFFALVERDQWKRYSELGSIKPVSFKEIGFIECYEASDLETAANKFYVGVNILFMLVIDPLRAQHPIKRAEKDGIKILKVFGAIPLDAVIDRIPLKRGRNGNFSVRVKHFD